MWTLAGDGWVIKGGGGDVRGGRWRAVLVAPVTTRVMKDTETPEVSPPGTGAAGVSEVCD